MKKYFYLLVFMMSFIQIQKAFALSEGSYKLTDKSEDNIYLLVKRIKGSPYHYDIVLFNEDNRWASFYFAQGYEKGRYNLYRYEQKNDHTFNHADFSDDEKMSVPPLDLYNAVKVGRVNDQKKGLFSIFIDEVRVFQAFKPDDTYRWVSWHAGFYSAGHDSAQLTIAAFDRDSQKGELFLNAERLPFSVPMQAIRLRDKVYRVKLKESSYKDDVLERNQRSPSLIFVWKKGGLLSSDSYRVLLTEGSYRGTYKLQD